MNEIRGKVKELSHDNSSPKTEKAVCLTLEKKGFVEGEHFFKQECIYNIPFCKSNKHKVDLILKNKMGDKLYVEIKGAMTYLEVNKLCYLLNESPYDFYILQLTEIDWIKPYEKSGFKRKIMKSKNDFEKQIGELVDFMEGNVSGTDLSVTSKKRLKNYIDFRRKDLRRWRVLQRKN